MTENSLGSYQHLPEMVGFGMDPDDIVREGLPGSLNGESILTPDILYPGGDADDYRDGDADNNTPTVVTAEAISSQAILDTGARSPDNAPNAGSSNSPEVAKQPINKLRIIYDEYGFFPETAQELTQVWTLRGYVYRLGGAARFLNTVLLHQRGLEEGTTEPEKAVRKIAKQWSGYSDDARSDVTMVHLLEEFATAYPNLDTDKLLSRDMMRSGSFARGVQTVQTVSALNAIADSETVPRRPYSLLNEQLDVAAMDRDELKTALWQAHLATAARKGFWQAVLRQASFHSLAQTIVEQSLEVPRE